MTVNPYKAPESSSLGTARRPVRWVALTLLAAPFILALPIREWAMNHAGSWFVSTDLEPDHRRAFLGQMYLGLILSISIWCFFGAAVLLWRDRFYPVLSGVAATIFGLLAIPAALFLAIGFSSFINHG